MNGNTYCHCSQPDGCAYSHAADEGIPNDDVAAFQLVYGGGGDELYHSIDDVMQDLLGVGFARFEPFEPGAAVVIELATGRSWDAAEFRDANV